MRGCGYLVISLDFELIWGIFDSVNEKDKSDYFKNTKNVIPKIIDLFQRQNIHATWATVGMLFNNSWDEWDKNKASLLPDYENEALSAYKFGLKTPRGSFHQSYFAPDLIKKIANTKGQEIATHTYSHYYCQEKGQNVDQFEADLERAILIAKTFNIELKSLVFPRNQIEERYLEVCKEKGIMNVRSNPEAWYWNDPSSTSIAVKLARTGDAYWNLGKKSYPLNILKSKELPVRQPASRFLRPVENNSTLRYLKLKRIKNEMVHAARNNEVYHLWWHPHNFGDNPEESLQELNEIITTYKELNRKYNFQSVNMKELGELVLNKI
jgi:peptidoglycan/xylan/chitin deacetylase (PgdA/CDA1 family)